MTNVINFPTATLATTTELHADAFGLTGSRKKTFNKYVARMLNKTPWTEGEIGSFKTQLNCCSTIGREAALAIYNRLFNEEGYSITPEQSEKGINYLRSKIWKKNGQPRNTRVQPFGYRERAIVADFSHFMFMGYIDEGVNRIPAYVPIYRVYARNGAYFEYTGVSYEMLRVVG